MTEQKMPEPEPKTKRITKINWGQAPGLDGPPCMWCNAPSRKTGSCYTCIACGETTGCG